MDSYWRLKNLVNDFPVSRQGSIYSWTVDQFQTSLGKNCGSMNMHELVKNISSAEETQEGLKRQGPISLPRTLSQKTVAEVWKFTQEDNTTNNGVTKVPDHLQRQQTLGDITLEEFLSRSGAKVNNRNTGLGVQFQPKAMVSDFTNNIVPRSHDSNMHQNVNGSMSTYQPQQCIMSKPNGYSYGGQQIRISNGVTGFIDQTVQAEKRSLVPRVATNPSGAIACSSVNPFPILNKMQKIDGTSSLLSPSPNIFSGSTSTTRGMKIDNAIAADNKIADKKLKRKIKNRESAARSRARKQAKTMELELELGNLKKKYQELLKEQVDMRKMQTEPGMIQQLQGRPERRLRRTKSDIM
ncbi:PREDICTED: ABSCISIC ACID-INSENSITIVE 5-like protein 8 [Camelina sativa]|uniref:ABSCISIC ACID-INSENSITIVE 5-like protein 8 n=1 Tax=Camelina sativa TaxID=90675 RepID=A0ABM0UJK8_CAMSA|nr:PREDICTED: ABSCISIC ACID-INSENSITIVE 5-like protein 8 [Camelina sativa]